MKRIIDPIALKNELWPDVEFSDEQKEIIRSVRDNKETYVVAGNKLGKDFVAGFIIPWFFIAHHPVKILVTSATEKHINNLWGEIDRFLRTAKRLLKQEDGGNLHFGKEYIWKILDGKLELDSYVMRAVVGSAHTGEGLSGHHAAYTLFVADEASAVADVAFTAAQGWAKRMLIFGNPNPCENFFREGVEAGDLLAA